MPICNIEQAIEEIRQGKMIILVDDESRENEGDLVVAAESVTPENINFMSKHGRGLICLPMSGALIDKLQLPMMARVNESRFGTNFTVSIEAREGVTTGISAFDRATTILAAIREGVKAEDIVTPGHVFPLRAREGGVLVRAGQTEGSVDLARLAGLKSAAVICEIMDENGSMARMPALEQFSLRHNIPIVLIKDLIQYRLRHDASLIRRVSQVRFPTEHGVFQLLSYQSLHNNEVHVALVVGDAFSDEPTLVRVHSECLTGDAFGSMRCDCGQQLKIAMQMIQRAGKGVILYMRQEGRGIGLLNKLKAYALQDEGCDTVEANHRLGFSDDLRDYGIGAQILLDLGISKMRLLTNNPKKIAALNGFGLEVVERVPLESECHAENFHYLKTKKEKMNHLLTLEQEE